jgi:hypothetical protein
MKLLTLLFSIVAHAATPGAVPSVTVSAPGANTGSVSIPPSDLSGTGVHKIFSIYGNGGVSTANYFSPLYRDGVAYATGSSTKAYCFDITAGASGANYVFQFASAQTVIPVNTSPTAFALLTSPLYQSGQAGSYVNVVSPTANLVTIIPGVYVFGDGSHVTYAAVQYPNSSSYYIHMDCFEQ